MPCGAARGGRPAARRSARERRTRPLRFGRAAPKGAVADIPLMCRQLVRAHMLQTNMTMKPATPTQMC